MEDILGKIMKDASSSKHAAVKQSCLESQELLANQHGLMRSPPYELRQKCLDTFHLALDSKHGKLINHALSGFQRMIWDKSFQSVFESDKEEHWFPLQLMRAVQPFSTHSDDVQVEILKVLLNMTCTHGQSLTATSITMLISICLEAYGNGTTAVRTAAQATVNQTLMSFCIMLQETDAEAEDQIDDSDAENDFNPLESLVEELYPVLHFTCEKLKDNRNMTRKPVGALLLQCVLSVLKNIKIDIHESSEFINFLWQELCPLLVALLGSPKTDKNIISSQKSCEGTEIGRGSGCLAAAPSCQGMEAKTIYSIAIELVRLTGSIGSLRPVLESLFHRMLLYLPIQHRLEALKAVKELFSKPELLLELAAPPLHATSDKDWISLDLDLIKICIDSLGECCHSSDNNVCYASVSCVSSLLKSLEQINNGEKIKEDFVLSINSQFRTLESSDYKGAKSERWLKTKLRNLLADKEKKSLHCKPKADVIGDSQYPNEKNHDDNVIKSSPASSDEGDSNDEFDKHVTSNESFETDKKANNDIKEENKTAENEESSDDEKPKYEEIDFKISNEATAKVETDNSELLENIVQEKMDLQLDIQSEDIDFKISSKTPTKVETDNSELSENIVHEKTDLHLDVQSDEKPPNSCGAQEIMSPVTESAEDALEYVSSSSSEATIDDIDDEVDIDPEEELDRLRKIPKTLLGEEDAGKEERERIENLCRARLEFAIQERQNARRFVKVFQSFLPELLSIRSSIEADQALQEFSSKYCEGLWQSQQTMKETTDSDVMSHITILNADGIYLALYSALLLNLKLIRKNYYRDPSCDIPLTEEQFIEEVHGSGVLVYLSAVWLAELYQQVLASNLLEEAGYKPVSLENYALVNLLSGLLFGTDAWWIHNVSDVDGLGNSFPGAQQLADYRRLERAIGNTQSTPNVDAGRKFNRRILTCCWETMLEVLSVLLNGTNSCGISSTIGFLLGTEGAKEEHRKTKDAIAESLDGLQRAAKLCNILGLQSNCSAVFAQLAIASCPLSEDIIFPKLSKLEYHQHFKKSLIPGRNKSLRLHASQILSMDVILSRGLELGSHSPDCWKYVFQCCLFVIQLENTYFSGHGNIQSVVSRPVLQTMNQTDSFELNSSSNNYLDLSSMPGSSIPPKLDVNDIINPNRGFAHTSDVIKDHQLLEAIEALSQLVDRLFEEAASRLNLSALISFLVELCAASQVQLFTQNYSRFASSSGHGSNLLLYHLGDVMLRCARGGRPLIHVMKAWSVVAPHFVEAACHKDSMISKKGVTTIHDIVSALLSSNSELPHFHFNEALFKPFENLLCLELCDTDIQEQIVSSICEFVEGCCTEIRSGWRPLFGALRAVRIPSISADINESGIEKEHIHHLRVVLDVFEAFLRTDNVFVFAYAAVDCLLCLLKHVKGPAELQDTAEIDCNTRNVPLDMCLAALKYLEKCSAILSSMYTIPTCPVFNSANRIQLHSEPNLVDPTIPEMEIIYFKDSEDVSDASENHNEGILNEDPMELKEIMEILKNSESSVSLQSLEKHTGIIHVWFLLLEGLAGSLATCPKQYQSHTMESLFNMFRNLKEIPGPEFGIYCVNHLLLPMLQNWLRRTTKIYRGWENFATNFKQCCGLATDLIVDYIQHLSELSTNLLSKRSGAYMMIQQLFLVLTECIAQPMEVISRLGCACIRHMIMSAGKYFKPEIWNIICINLKRCCSVSLHDIKQLMVCFHSDSDNFYGDIGEVKVAARKDTTVRECERLRQISHQVFLLDCQQSSIHSSASVCIEDDERTYTFLLFPPNHQQDDPDSSVIRVPFCSLVVGLLSHQILLQTLGSMLLQGTKYMLPTLMTLLPSENCLDLPNEAKKPGFLSKFSSDQLEILFKCLEDSYETACAFDTRPGLKFLVQKVAQTNVAANLYKQAGVSWSIHMVVLFELCFSSASINLDYVKSCISSKIIEECKGEINCRDTCEVSEQNLKKNFEESNSCPEMILNVFLLLRDKFKEVCETYTEYTIDKDGLSSIVDRMSDQPIFFLATPADELSDFIFPTKSNDSQSNVSKEKFEPSYDSSDSEDAYIGNEEESKDKIYTIANKQTVDSLINEYKKRKNQHSMPSRLRERLSKRNSDGSKRRTSSNNSVPEEIVNQRRNSIMKDGEAHLQVFKQLIQSFLDLHQSLTDEQFQAFLPIFFPGVQFLVAYTSDSELRLSISEWLQRLAVCCNFYVPSNPSH